MDEKLLGKRLVASKLLYVLLMIVMVLDETRFQDRLDWGQMRAIDNLAEQATSKDIPIERKHDQMHMQVVLTVESRAMKAYPCLT